MFSVYKYGISQRRQPWAIKRYYLWISVNRCEEGLGFNMRRKTGSLAFTTFWKDERPQTLGSAAGAGSRTRATPPLTAYLYSQRRVKCRHQLCLYLHIWPQAEKQMCRITAGMSHHTHISLPRTHTAPSPFYRPLECQPPERGSNQLQILSYK